VELEHWLFRKVDTIRFHLHPGSGQAGVSIMMTKNEGFLTLQALRKEFSIDVESADGQMLNQIADALKYVKGLMIGDKLPQEILTGEASWKLSPKHMQVAHQRITLQLMKLVSLDEPTTSDPAELLKLADDPEIKRKINESFEVAAVELGMQREQKQEVIGFVDILAAELGYIEPLREKFQILIKMRSKVQLVRKMNAANMNLRETSDQVARLTERAIGEFGGIFADIDARTAEILPMLGSIDESIAMIRKTRDNLHVRFMAMQELLDGWNKDQVEYSTKVSQLLQDTYQFLAPRFMSFVDWTSKSREESKIRSKVKPKPMAW